MSLFFVQGHSNISGSEKADELARLASSSCFTGPEPEIAVSSILQRIITNWKVHRFKSHCDWLTTSETSKKFYQNKQIETPNLSLNRSNLKILTGILTGHNLLNKHLHTIGVSSHPNYDKCGAIGTEHFLCNCPADIRAKAPHL